MTRMTVVPARQRAGRRPTVDLSTSLGSLDAARPGADRLRVRRRRPRAGPVPRPHRASAPSSPSRSCCEPRSGRATPRMAETPSGMLNSIGLQGPGIDAFVDHDLAWLRDRGARAVVSIAGGSVEEYQPRSPSGCATRRRSRRSRSTSRAPTSRTAARSSPATPSRPRRSCRPSAGPPTRASRCSRSCRPTSPTSSQIARAVVDAGADGLSHDQHAAGHGHRHRHHAPGPGRRDRRAVRAGDPPGRGPLRVAGPRGDARVPILGMGGIRPAWTPCSSSWPEPRRCSVGTAVFHDPSAPARVSRELAEALAARGIERLSDAVGLAHRPEPEPEPVADSRRRRAVGRGRRDRAGAGRRMSTRMSSAAAAGRRAPIAVALDAPDLATAVAWAAAVGPSVSTVKVGLEAYLRDGAERRTRGARRRAGLRAVPGPEAARHPQHRGRRGPRRGRPGAGLPHRPRLGRLGDDPRRGRRAAGHPDHRRHRPHLAVRRRPRGDRAARPGPRRGAEAGRARRRGRRAGPGLLAPGGRRRARRGRRRRRAHHPGRAPGRGRPSATRPGWPPRSRPSPTAPTCSSSAGPSRPPPTPRRPPAPSPAPSPPATVEAGVTRSAVWSPR